MLIYLDANLIQYCADYEDFLFGDNPISTTSDPNLLRELTALHQLIELEQLGNEWHFAAPNHLMEELLSGKPTAKQREVYSILLQTWNDSGWPETIAASNETVPSIYSKLESLSLRDEADRRHLAEAVVLEA